MQLGGKADARVGHVRAYFQVQNQKPNIESIRVADDSESSGDEKKVGGADGEESPSKGEARGGKPLRGSSRAPSTKRHISWKASDVDDDKLVYRLFYRADEDEVWIPMPLDEPLDSAEYSWNTESVPDGWYRIKVVASDERSNPVDQSLAEERISDAMRIDNTRPKVENLKFDRRTQTVSGKAEDGLSFITRLEYSIDGGDWIAFAPHDGIFDNQSEAFELQLDDVPPGTHHLAVRAADEEGNIGAEKVRIEGR